MLDFPLVWCEWIHKGKKIQELHKTQPQTNSRYNKRGRIKSVPTPVRQSVCVLSPLQGKVKDTCIFIEEPGTGSMAFNCFLLVCGGTCQCLLICLSRGHSQSMTGRPLPDWTPIVYVCVCRVDFDTHTEPPAERPSWGCGVTTKVTTPQQRPHKHCTRLARWGYKWCCLEIPLRLNEFILIYNKALSVFKILLEPVHVLLYLYFMPI